MKTISLSNRKVQLALGAAILALLVVGAISYRAIAASTESDRMVRQTHEVLEDLQNLRSAMGSIESSYRGFALTGKESYLDSCRAGILSVEQGEGTVRDLTADNPKQAMLIPTLESLAAQKIQFGETVIRLRQTAGMEAAADAVRNGTDERVMGEFQDVVRQMHDEELRLLMLRGRDAERHLGQRKTILILGTVLGLLIAAGAGWSIQSDSIERRLAEEALRDQEEKYRMLLDGVQDYAIFTLDPHGIVASWNAGAERIKGYKADEIIGQNFSRFYLPSDVDQGKPKAELQVAAASGRSEVEHWRVRKDGSRFWANVVITAARNSSGNLLGFSEISRDISERKETEAKYRGLLEAAPDAMVVVNQDGEIVLLNVQAEKQFAYHRDELVGQKVKNIIPEGFAERLLADGLRSVEDALAQQIGTGIELTGRRKDGSDFPIEIMLSPLGSAEGILVTAAIRDISVRKAAEEHLAQMEGRYRGLLEAAPDAMVVVNQGGEIVLLNVQAEKQFGYRRDELVGQKVKNIIPEGFAERLIADGTRSAAEALAQQIGTGIELYGRRKDGSEFPIEIMLSPLESPEGILVTAAIRDITARKKSEQHLMKTVGELKRSNDELEQFAYVASHDLQEPLRMVASYTQLLAKRYKGRLDSEADEFIAYAVDGSNRMQGLIRDLLAYSRAGANGKALHEVSSEKALKDALSNLRATIQESGAVVTHDSLPDITSDDTQLVQVFQNLVGNAIKYRSAEVPQVHVSATKNGGKEWIFSVRDNGLGIDPQYFERIFVLFQRLHGREEFKGTGIGLTICKKIVERLGGKIWVESPPEEGSIFYFSLPERDGNDGVDWNRRGPYRSSVG
jgi:PAS domain S-box-containing protein